MKILSFGEIIWDIYENGRFIGGAGLNFAAHSAKCKADSFMLSGVGNDELGKSAKKKTREFGVNADFIKKSDKKTGQCIVTLDENATPCYNVLEDTAYDNIIITDNDIEKIKGLHFDALYFGTLIQRNSVSKEALKKICENCTFPEIVCDINLRKNCYDSESVEFCFKNATVLKISEEEEPLLKELGIYSSNLNSLEDICEEICEKYSNIRYIIFTLGEKGALVYSSKDKKVFKESGVKVKVRSTVGAGDSFFAAWTASYLSGKSVEEATKRAIKLSSFVVSNTDAIPEYTFADFFENH